MTSKELITEYFKGGNAVNISNNTLLKAMLQAIKEMGDELDKEEKEIDKEIPNYQQPKHQDY